MGPFTFIPVWVFEDAVVLALAMIGVVFIVKHEENPASTLLEFFCFVFLYAAVYENFATLMGWYGYGRSIVMVFNVPITVPVIEYLVVYTSLRFLGYLRMPTWVKPIVVGFMGMVFDFSLDPVAIKQIYTTNEATISRWSWYPEPGDAAILGEPVYNFPGWVLLCGFAAACILAGRWWYAKSGKKAAVGYAYPFVAMIAALGLIVSPLSRFSLWLWPFMQKGSVAEWIMLGFWLVVPSVLLVLYGRKTIKPLRLKEEYLILLTLIAFHAVNIVGALAGAMFDALPLVLAAAVVQSGIVVVIARNSQRMMKA